MKNSVDKLKLLSAKKSLIPTHSLKCEIISVVREYIDDECLDFGSNFSISSFVLPGVPTHAGFGIWDLDKIKLIAVPTHAEKLRVGECFLNLPLLGLNGSIDSYKPEGLFKLRGLYDSRPSRCVFTLTDENKLLPEEPTSVINSLGLFNDYEKIKMFYNLRMSWYLTMLKSKIDEPISLPYQIKKNHMNKMIKLSDNEELKSLSKSLYYKILEYNDKIAIYDSTLSSVERLKFVKFVEIVLNKTEYNIIFKDGYWDSHINSNDFEWIDILDSFWFC